MAKVMISIPDEDLSRIDEEAARRGTTRSALLREAAARELARRDPQTVMHDFDVLRARLSHVSAADWEAARSADKQERARR